MKIEIHPLLAALVACLVAAYVRWAFTRGSR